MTGRRELAQVVRVATRRPAFSLAVVLVLALGIGANTAVFSLINAVLLRPLPYPHSDQLYTLFEQDSLGGGQLASYPTFSDWREQSDVFSGLAYVRGTGLNVQTDQRAGILLAAFVSTEFFPTLGVPALMGRVPAAEDYGPGGERVAVLSHRAWRRFFGGDASVLGRTVSLAGNPATIVGVMPPTFSYPDWGVAETDLWLPITGLPRRDLAALSQRDFHADSRVVARLQPGVTEARAQAQMDAIARRLAAAYPEASRRWTSVRLFSLMDFAVRDARPRLLLLSGAVVAVLLICCVNLANLYLAQGAARSAEFAIRAALGAARGRVLRQLLGETVTLAAVGGVLGLGVAIWVVQLARVSAARLLPRLDEVNVDLRVLAFAAGVTVVTAVVFALLAARRVASSHLVDSLGSRGGTHTVRGGRGRLPGWLVAAQVALTMVLLVGAALLTKSFWRLSAVDPGFNPHGLVSVWILPPSPRYDEPELRTELYLRLADAVRAVPGVTGVALINHAPFSGGGIPSRAAIGGAPVGTEADIPVLFRTVSAGYFAMMGIPVLAGREFGAGDQNGPPGPLLVNDVLARRWGDRSPMGDRLAVLKAAKELSDFGQPLAGTVVGVVRDVKHFGLDAEPEAVVYVPFTHNPWSAMTIVARTAGRPEPLLRPIEAAVRAVDPAIPLEGERLGAGTMDDRIERSYAPRRLNAALVGGFAALALLLAAIGIYGVMSYTVALETREIGIRIALGALPSGVLRAVVARAAGITLAGVAAGLVAAGGLARLLRGLLYQVAPTDPGTFAVVALLLLVVATLAAYLPARRAASVDPVAALRSA